MPFNSRISSRVLADTLHESLSDTVSTPTVVRHGKRQINCDYGAGSSGLVFQPSAHHTTKSRARTVHSAPSPLTPPVDPKYVTATLHHTQELPHEFFHTR